MRILLVAVLASGCLASPPGPAEDPTGDDGAGHDGSGDDGSDGDGQGGADGGATPRCLPGSALDLVYIDQLEVANRAVAQTGISGLALLVNPGPDTVVVGDLRVSDVVPVGGLRVQFSFTGPSGSELPPDTAHGSLAQDAIDVIMDEMSDSEDWTNSAAPVLSAVLSGIPEEGAIPIELRVGDYVFEISIGIAIGVEDAPPGALAARRVTALCP